MMIMMTVDEGHIRECCCETITGNCVKHSWCLWNCSWKDQLRRSAVICSLNGVIKDREKSSSLEETCLDGKTIVLSSFNSFLCREWGYILWDRWTLLLCRNNETFSRPRLALIKNISLARVKRVSVIQRYCLCLWCRRIILLSIASQTIICHDFLSLTQDSCLRVCHFGVKFFLSDVDSTRGVSVTANTCDEKAMEDTRVHVLSFLCHLLSFSPDTTWHFHFISSEGWIINGSLLHWKRKEVASPFYMTCESKHWFSRQKYGFVIILCHHLNGRRKAWQLEYRKVISVKQVFSQQILFFKTFFTTLFTTLFKTFFKTWTAVVQIESPPKWHENIYVSLPEVVVLETW